MKKRKHLILFAISLLVFTGCSNQSKQEMSLSGLDEVEREEINYMIPYNMVSDGKEIYILQTEFIYRIDMENCEIVLNCNRPLCKHRDTTCSAFMGYDFASLSREGNQVYYLGNSIYKIEKNGKKEVGHGKYGAGTGNILFGDNIAFFKDNGTVVVESISTGKEMNSFNNVKPASQGNFYYDESLYIIDENLALLRLDLNSGEQEVIEESGTTRASIYHNKIYYVLVNAENGHNKLICYETKNGTKKEILENVFYYNMKNEDIYYLSYPDYRFYHAKSDGSDLKEINISNVNASDLFIFPEQDKFIIGTFDNKMYIYDSQKEKLDLENPLSIP